MATEFHPSKSRVDASKLSEFLNSMLSGDLTEVPGIGPATAKLLAECNQEFTTPDGTSVKIPGITSTFGLIGVYLAFKNKKDAKTGEAVSVGPVEHTNRFYHWWCSLGTPAGFRAGVVHSLCEKVSISFPGLYNADEFGAPMDS